jgi:acyl-CoA thioester hydrolase
VTEYSLPIVPRYAEVDQQAVVFNAHYLTWFDEAVAGSSITLAPAIRT